MNDTSDCTNCNGSEERNKLRAEIERLRADIEYLIGKASEARKPRPSGTRHGSPQSGAGSTEAR